MTKKWLGVVVECPWCPNSPINWRDCQFVAVRGRMKKKMVWCREVHGVDGQQK